MTKSKISSCIGLDTAFSISYDSNYIDYPHRHSFWEMILFTCGQGSHTINGSVHTFHPGDIVLLSPAETHCIQAPHGIDFECIKVKFSYNLYRDQLKQLGYFEHFPVMATLKGRDYTHAIHLLDMLNNEHSRAQKESVDFGLTLLTALILLLQRNLTDKQPDPGKNQQILLYLQEHFREPVSITAVASALNYSPKYFSRMFVREFGTPFQEYLKELRLNYAYHLILYSDQPIIDICYDAGFRSPAYFSKSFKLKYGQSPSHMRKVKTASEV